MGRRRKRRKTIVRIKRKIPDILECPLCGFKSVIVEIKKVPTAGKGGTGKGEEKKVIVKCGHCKAYLECEYDADLKPIDYYSQYVDACYEGRVSYFESKTEGKEEELGK